jgi:hypothetical protein
LEYLTEGFDFENVLVMYGVPTALVAPGGEFTYELDMGLRSAGL